MAKITKDTLIMDIVQINPEAVGILQRYGMHCLGCALAHMETIEQAVGVHGVDLDKLLEELNNLPEQEVLQKKKFGIKPLICFAIVQKLYVLSSVTYGKYAPSINPQFFSLACI